MPIHLGFDMGIRNLAFCLIEFLEDVLTIDVFVVEVR